MFLPIKSESIVHLFIPQFFRDTAPMTAAISPSEPLKYADLLNHVKDNALLYYANVIPSYSLRLRNYQLRQYLVDSSFLQEVV
jgi:hypothetical protein